MFPSAAPSAAATATTTTPTSSEVQYARVDADQESGSEYWTCSECTCTTSGTYYTCPECQSLQDLFVYDDTRPPSEEDLPLDEILRRRSRSRSKSGSKSKDGTSKSRRSRSRSRSSSRGHDGKDARAKTKTSTLPKRLRDAPQDHPDAIERARSRSRSRSKSLTREIVASFKEFRDKVTRGRSRSKSSDRMVEEDDVKKLKGDVDEEREPPQRHPSAESGRSVNLGNGDVRIPIHIHVDTREGITTPEKQDKDTTWKEVSSEKVTTRLIFHGSEGRGDRTLTLEQVTSLRTPETSSASDVIRDVIRWNDPPPSSAAGSTSHQTSATVQPQTLLTGLQGPSSTSTDPTNSSQATITTAPPISSAGRVPSVDASVLGLPTSTLVAAASPAAVDFLLQATKGGASEVLRSLVSPMKTQTLDTQPINTLQSITTDTKTQTDSMQTTLPKQYSLYRPPSPKPADDEGKFGDEKLKENVTYREAGISEDVENLQSTAAPSKSFEPWPSPPCEPDLLQFRKIEQQQLAEVSQYSTNIDEDLPLPPPPRPPTPPSLGQAEMPPPRPPEPRVSSNDIQNNNYLLTQDLGSPYLLASFEHEIAPPRPSLPIIDDPAEEDAYEQAPPRPDPPSDDADDEREPTPPRPEPPLEYEFPYFQQRPSLPTIRETSPLLDDFPVMEEFSDICLKEPPPIRPSPPIIKSFTPPRPTEVDTAVMTSPVVPTPPEITDQQQELLEPLEAAPLPSSPSEHPCTSTSPDKSGTSPDKTGEESDVDAAAQVPTTPAPEEPVVPVASEAPIPEPSEASAEDAEEPSSSFRVTGLPPQHPPRPDEDELIRKMKKPWNTACGGANEIPAASEQEHPISATMSDTGGATSPTPGMSDSEGVGGVGGRTTSASGVSRTSGTSRTSMTSSAPTTTISTIAVQSGNTRIVIALLQSAEWLELRVVELTPGMVYLGATLEEASQLQRAHEEVLAKLQSKQSPVEDLLNQADQLISTQRPRAEVYAAMAESLGLAWKDLNQQLETRKEILDMGVAFHSRARQYSDSMDAAERAYTDNVMPNDAEGARQLLSALHDHKRSILEASMYTLQEAQALLARLRGLAAEGASLDSRPLHIKTNIEFTCSQIEHYLESLHDRRRFLDGLFNARKHHLEQCLALCLLYQDLTEAVTALKQLRDEVSDQQGLGESQGNAEILLHEHMKRQTSAKEIQDRCIMLLKKAEKMASSGHYAGLEARSRAYSVLEAATALHETCDTRTALLQQSILFFKLAQTALTKLDQAEVQVAGLGGEGAQRLSLVVGVVEEAIQPALAEGYAILEVTGGRNQPHNMGISLVVEELERRRSHLSSVCVASTEQVLQRTELSNAFLERYNTIESWLVRIGDAFLQGHQDPGGSLSLARDFLHLHQTLNHDVMEKKNEIDALASFLETLIPELSEEDGNNYKDKMQALIDHWTALKKLLDIRIAITEKYVKFHEDAETVNNEHEALELLLKDAHGEDRREEVEAKWEQVQKLYLDLCNFGKAFCQEVRNAEDPYLDSNRAVLCVENILEQLGKRRLVITDLHSHFHMKITTTKEMLTMWNTYRDNVSKMRHEMSRLEDDFCPLLRGNPTDPVGVANTLEERLNAYVAAVKKTQDDIQNMMTRAEVMSYKGDQAGARDEVIGSLLQLYQSLQNKATEYQILGHMLIQWCKNIAEIHRSCDKLESQFGNVSLDIGGVEGQIREHEASKQAVLELLKFAQNEAASIITKIREQCPPDAGAQDISVIEDMLQRRGKVFETVWTQHQHLLERQLKRSQYHVDLQVISDQLRDLSEQLTRMRGHYGDSLAAATNMQSAFRQFQFTVEMLERRIQTFVSTTVKMLGPEDDSGEVQLELAELEKKWSTFQMQVGQSQKSIELSIDYFKLVEEAEDWFKQGSKLLVAVAGDSANIQTPEEAERLRSRIEIFLQPGQEVQQERINKISTLAFQLYGDTAPKQTEVVSLQHTHMIESFTIINRNLTMMVENLRTAEEHRETQKKEKEELAASLAAAQAEAEAARLAAAAAEEARKAAEEVARTMAIPVEPIVPERVEIEIQTEAVPLPPEEEPPRQDDLPPPKKVKLIDDEPQPMAPVFMTPLVGATVTEGVKFTFECRVIGFPMPEVEWLKDNMSITANPDYKTSFEEGVCCLTIEETFTEDSALFTCKAVNCAGIAETSATLTVKEAEVVEVMAPPKFTKQLVDSTAQEGSSYQLEATVEGHPLPVVSWAKDGSCVDESPDYVITYNNGECVLRFEEVFLEDQAEYSCRATNNLGEDTTKAKLAVTAVELSERPKIIMPLSNVMARAGQKFKLECHVTGTPTPTLAWFHNNKLVKETPDCKINFDGKVATLVMSEAFPKNAGVYTIVAKNTAGEAQCSANVSVKGRIPTETSDSEVTSDIDVEPIKPTIQLALKDTSVKEGKTARLDCVIVGQPEPEVIWYHDDTPVKESSDFKLLFHGDRCSLVIQEAFLEDAGIYRVVAMNSAGEASTACFLNVEPEPELAPPKADAPAVAPRFSQLMTDSHVTEGQAVTLSATVTGQPTPTIAWFREGLPLIPDNELQIHEDADGHVSAHIFSATLDHTGQYEIVASNCAGTAKCVAYLSIEQRLPTPPVSTEPQEPPVFIKPLVDASVTSGSGVKFEAEVTGQPMPTVHWTLNDSPITGQEYFRGHVQYVLGSRGGCHTLQIPITTKLQAGRIAIVAENPSGKAVSAANMNVLDPPSAPAKRAPQEQQQLQPQQQPAMFHKESHVTTSSSSSFSSMMQQTTIMESSHMTKVVTSDGKTDEKKHSMSASSSSQVKTATGLPTVEVHGSHLQEVKQEGGGPAVISDKVSFVKMEGEKITQQIAQDSTASYATVMPQPKKIVVGKKKLSPARFIVPLQGVIANDGDRVVLECTIDGHPEPSVTWTRNGGPVSEDAQIESHLNKATLVLPNVSQNQGGHYTCVIKNDAGMAQCTCDVIIKKTQFPPVISKRLHPRVVSVGERLHLEIDVTGTPPPEVTWTKDGVPIARSEHVELKSEGTRHILVIQQAALSDSGRYSAIASNAAGRAESLADVRVTQPLMEPPPTTHKIIFTDTVDESKSISETIEEGHTKTVKRAIEEVTIEAPTPPFPAKIHKPQPKPTPLPLPTPPNYQASSPEPTVEMEEEVRRPPGKLKNIWPPPPSEDEDIIAKSDSGIEITSKNVSSIISSFSAVSDEAEIISHRPPKVLPKPRPKSFPTPIQQAESDIQLQPEPEPEYGYISPTELEKMAQEQRSPEAKSPEFFLAPEPSPDFVLERESSPEYVLAPEPEPVTEVSMDTDMPQHSDFISLVKQEYRKAMTSVMEPSKVLSPIPEVVSESTFKQSPESETDVIESPDLTEITVQEQPVFELPKLPTPEHPRAPTPEPPKVPTPEPPKVPTPELPKIPTPEPPRVPTPEPAKVPTPEPAKVPTIEPTKVPSPEPPKLTAPEPIKIPTPEPPKTPTPEPQLPRGGTTPEPKVLATPEQSLEISQIEEIQQNISPVITSEQNEYGSKARKEVRTETTSLESSFYESKKSFSSSSFSTVETKVYTTGKSSPSLEPTTVDSTVITTETGFPKPDISESADRQVQQDFSQIVTTESEPAMDTDTADKILVSETKESEALVHESYIEEAPLADLSAKEQYVQESKSPLDTSPKPELSEVDILEAASAVPTYQVPLETAIEVKTVDGTDIESFNLDTSDSKVLPTEPEQILMPEGKGYALPLREDGLPEQSYAAGQSSNQISSYSSVSSEMKTMFVTSSDVQTKVFTPAYVQDTAPSVFLQQQQVSSSLSATKLQERVSTEETIRPPKHPEREEVKEPKKPKKKRESVIQLAKRLEETIIPMSPDEVPGGIRMFPSPKQPSTPVRESPTTVRENASAQGTPTTEDEIFQSFKAEKFPELEPFPFAVQERPRMERPRSMPPPMPRKFIPSSYTDSEYESDMEVDQRLNLKPLVFEAPLVTKPEPVAAPKPLETPPVVKPRPVSFGQEFETPVVVPKPRPLSVGRDPLPPFAFGSPPIFDGGMRPDVLKKEEVQKEETPKSVAPKKKSKLVEKFLASAGQNVEEEVVKPAPKKPKKKEVIPPPKSVPYGSAQKEIPSTQPISAKLVTDISTTPAADKFVAETPPENKQTPAIAEKAKPEEPKTEKISTKPMVDIDTRGLVTPSKLAKVWPPIASDSEDSTKQSFAKSSYSETKTHVSSVSYQKMESKITKEYSQTTSKTHEASDSKIFSQKPPDSVAVQIVAPEPKIITMPTSAPPPMYTPEPEPTPVYIPEPEPALVYIPEPEPAPVYIPEPELAPVHIPEPEPAPVHIPEPEPVPVYIPDPVSVSQKPEVLPVMEPPLVPTYAPVPEPEPTPVYIPEPEPTPVYIPEPEPTPVYIPEPEPTPVYIPEPEPTPVYIPEPEPTPVYIPEPEPTPVYIPEPEPTPVYIPEPEPVPSFAPEQEYPSVIKPETEPSSVHMPEPVVMQVVSPVIGVDQVTQSMASSPAPGFRSVRAPTPKRGQTPAKAAAAAAPPPPFDMTPPVLETPQVPKPVHKVQPEPALEVKSPIKIEPKAKPAEAVKKQDKKLDRASFAPLKVPTGGKMLPVWPPKTHQEAAQSTLSVKFRSQSVERPPVTEAPSLPIRPHEAPPAVYWSSSVTVQEKQKPWSQPVPQMSTHSSTSMYQSSTSKSFTEETKRMSKHISESLTKQEKIQSVPDIKSPPVMLVPQKPIISDIPDLVIPSVFSPVPTPQANIAVYPPIHKVPKIEPKKETSVKSPTPLKEGTVISTIIPLPPLEPFPYSVEPDKGKRPRGRAPSMPRKFVPSSFTESEYESDYESAPSPLSRLYLSDSETQGYKPLNIHLKRGRSKQPKKPSPPPPSTLGPPQPFDYSLSRGSSLFPEGRVSTPGQFTSKAEMSQSKHIIQTVKLLASQITPENKPVTRPVQQKEAPVAAPVTIPKIIPSVVQKPNPSPAHTDSVMSVTSSAQKSLVKTEETHTQSSGAQVVAITEQREKGVMGIRKKFESGGPVPVPQAVHVPSQALPAVTSHGITSSTSGTSRNIPVVADSDGNEESTGTGSLKKKPVSPKSKKKAESTQITAFEQEESGYVADTEGTLPRRHTKTAQSSTTSTSFTKSESFMSSSFSKSESKSYSSSEFGQMPSSSFSMGSAFPSGGMASNGIFPSTSFSMPTPSASTVGQTSHFSSSFKSTESKSSQMFTSRSEEVHEERRSEPGPKSTRTSPPQQDKKPKFEEFRKETRGQPGSYGPFSEDTYYAMKDESDISTGSTRTQKKVEVKSETHVAVMSDKKVEVYETTSVDVSPGLPKKKMATEKKMEKIIVKETPETSRAKPDLEPKHFDMKKSDTVSSKTQLITETTVQQGTKKELIKKTEPATDKPVPAREAKVPKITPLKSTELVMKAVTKHEQEKEELDLKPFPYKAEPEKPKKPRGAPPPQPSKFIKGELRESDYDSDYEGRIPIKWKPIDSDAEEISYSTVKPSPTTTRPSQPKERAPTPPTVFDKPPQFEGPPRPKIDFPESETEPEREISPEIVLPEKVETLLSAEAPKIVPKEPKEFKSQPKPSPPPPAPPRSPSPDLKPGTPPEEDYIEPQSQPKPAPFTNAIGVESTKITKIADSSKYHQRFVSMQQTTRVIKFTDSRTAPPSTESHQQPKPQQRPKPLYKEQEQKSLPDLEPFPFTPEPPKPKKDRGQPPPKPKKFQKGEMTESDYDSDYEGRIRPKWQPTDSDAEDPSYNKVKPKLKDGRKPSESRERTPTPPTAFEVPPGTGGPWRPVIEPPEHVLPKEPSPEVIIPKVVALKEETPKKTVAKVPKMIVKTPERSVSPPLPSPGPTPEEGVIIQETQYIVNKVDVKSKVKPPPEMEVQTYIEKPYTKVTERTEKTFTKMKMEEELRMKKERLERVTTTVTEYDNVPAQTLATVQSELKVEVKQFPDLEPFPFEPDRPKPKRERGPPPPKPSKFVKGEFRESDYDSDYEGKVRPKWKPAESDVEDPEYTPVRPPLLATKQVSQERDRTPTPPSKFDVPPETGGPLRPTIDHIERPVVVKKEKSPEIIIPKIEHVTTKSAKIRPKAPALKPKEPKPDKPREPTPPLPEPGPQPEVGYVPGRVLTTQEDKEDAHIRMIKKKIESKKGFEIDIDITDIYDFVSESDHDKTDTESSTRKPFPKLEPFPYEPDPARPKRQRGPPPPHPKKFLKGEFRESDHESDYDAPIAPKWVPPDSEGDEYVYRRVAPPAGEIGRQRSESTGKEPSPPSKFDQPPRFEGPPRPVMDLSDLPRRERRESLEEYSIPRFPKVEFKPFDLDDDVTTRTRGGITTDTETEPESQVKGGIDKKYAKTAQKVVSHQFEDMTQTFRHKAQKFAEQLVTEVFAAREGSVPAEPAGEPPSLPEELKTCSVSPDSTAAPPVSTAAELTSPGIQEPQAYRDESRVSEFGTKHIDPDTGLIYFKYDFGYEFGVILPGEAKKVEKKKGVNGDVNGHIPIPVIHEKTDSSKTKGSEKLNGHIHSSQGTAPLKSTSTLSEQKDSPKISSSQSTAPEQVTSPQPSLQSDISETDREYQQYMGKMIPEFVPKKQAQFRPISGDPYSDSEGESEQPSPAKIPEASPSTHMGPKRFVPLVPGATVQPKSLPLEGTPADALYTTTELGASSRSHSGGGRGGKAGVRGSGGSSRPGNVVQRGPHPPERT